MANSKIIPSTSKEKYEQQSTNPTHNHNGDADCSAVLGPPSDSWHLVPGSKFMLRWDYFMTALLFFTATVTPFEVAFLTVELDTLFVLNRCVDLGFIVVVIFVVLSAILHFLLEGHGIPLLLMLFRRKPINLVETENRSKVSQVWLTHVLLAFSHYQDQELVHHRLAFNSSF
jgi:hypothetical protein